MVSHLGFHQGLIPNHDEDGGQSRQPPTFIEL